MQGVKRQSQSTQEVYEQELRKLRDVTEKKEYELNELGNRLKRLSSESEYEVLRLREEKEKLRAELAWVEQDRKR